MTIPSTHDSILIKYPRVCEQCMAMMTPLYVKVAHKKAPEPTSHTIHYLCEKCGIEYDLNVSVADDPYVYIDPKMGIIL